MPACVVAYLHGLLLGCLVACLLRCLTTCLVLSPCRPAAPSSRSARSASTSDRRSSSSASPSGRTATLSVPRPSPRRPSTPCPVCPQVSREPQTVVRPDARSLLPSQPVVDPVVDPDARYLIQLHTVLCRTCRRSARGAAPRRLPAPHLDRGYRRSRRTDPRQAPPLSFLF